VIVRAANGQRLHPPRISIPVRRREQSPQPAVVVIRRADSPPTRDEEVDALRAAEVGPEVEHGDVELDLVDTPCPAAQSAIEGLELTTPVPSRRTKEARLASHSQRMPMRDAHLIVTTTTPSASSYLFRNFRVDHASMHGLILHYSVATRLYGLWYTRVGLFMSMSISVCASGTTHDTTRRRKALLISHCWSELIASV
jgi:hypothetical protein